MRKHERNFSRREIVRLYLRQKTRGDVNVKQIKSVLGYHAVTYIYKVIREFESGL